MSQMSKREIIFRLSATSEEEDTVFVFFTSFGSVECKLVGLLNPDEIDNQKNYPVMQLLLSENEYLQEGQTSYKDLLKIEDNEVVDYLLLKDVCVRNVNAEMHLSEMCLFLDDVRAISYGPLEHHKKPLQL